MTTLNFGKMAAAFIMTELPDNMSRDAITIASGEGVVKAGTVLGKVGNDTGTVSVGTVGVNAGNTGNGVLTKANPAHGAGVLEGTYSVTCIEPATNGGVFSVEGPNGVQVGIARVGVAFDGVVKFTIADGATDFVAGDGFTLPVSIANAATAGLYRVADPTNTDGSQNGSAINIYEVDATSADAAVAAIVRQAQVNNNFLTYDANVDDASKKAAQHASLETRSGIIVR